jgi:hypothetical protein
MEKGLMSLSIQLTDSISDITKNINAAIAEEVNNILNKNTNILINGIKSLIPNWIRSQPEIISLLSKDPTSLAGYFGIFNDVDSIVNNIILSVIDSAGIKFVPYDNKLRGGLELYFQPDNFINLLSLPQGHTVYQGGDLHWLDWLLKRGDTIIVMNYQYNPQTGLGRSGLGNMIGGGSFRIPPQFSGTKDDNFITRALLGPTQEQEIAKLFDKILG